MISLLSKCKERIISRGSVIPVQAECFTACGGKRALVSLDYLCSVRTYAYHAYMAANELFKSCDILPALLGKLIKASAL